MVVCGEVKLGRAVVGIPADSVNIHAENFFANECAMSLAAYAQSQPMPPPASGISARLAQPARVLVVDDSPDDLRLLFEMMSAHDINVAVAFSGSEGVDKAVLSPPDLILMDVTMPGMDGFAACRLLKANPRTQWIPLIFLTASNEAELRVQGLCMGGVDYIVKPFDASETLVRVGIHLSLSKRLREAERSLTLSAHRDLQTDVSCGAVSRNAATVQAAMAYLRTHMASPPSPELLARLVGTNETSLNQLFNAHCGLPVYGWLREERMAQARSLLVNTDTAIARVSDYLGFSTASNFAKAFRERFGMSPRALRQTKQQLRHHERAAAAEVTLINGEDQTADRFE